MRHARNQHSSGGPTPVEKADSSAHAERIHANMNHCQESPTTDRREGGFTFIELLVGMIAAIVALGSIISATVQVSKVRKLSEEVNLAHLACVSTLEDLRAMPTADLLAQHKQGFDVPGINGQAGGLTPVSGDADGLCGSISVTVDKSGGGSTLYHVLVRAEWQGASGPEEFEIETLMGERSLK